MTSQEEEETSTETNHDNSNPVPEVVRYFEKHEIRHHIEEILQELAEKQPAVPWEYIEDRAAQCREQANLRDVFKDLLGKGPDKALVWIRIFCLFIIFFFEFSFSKAAEGA